eukprot:28208_3
MYAIEPGESPTRSLNWKSLGFLSHIKRRTIGDRFPLSLWEVWFCSTLGVPIPELLRPAQRCACNAFHYDAFGDHFRLAKLSRRLTGSLGVYRLGGILGSVGHKVKIHKITPATGKERGDLEIKDYVVLQKPQEQADRLPPPRTLILISLLIHIMEDHTCIVVDNQIALGGAPELDGALKVVARKKIIHYRQLYLDRPEPIAFMPVAVDTSGRIYDDFLRLLFLHA